MIDETAEKRLVSRQVLRGVLISENLDRKYTELVQSTVMSAPFPKPDKSKAPMRIVRTMAMKQVKTERVKIE